MRPETEHAAADAHGLDLFEPLPAHFRVRGLEVCEHAAPQLAVGHADAAGRGNAWHVYTEKGINFADPGGAHERSGPEQEATLIDLA